MSPIRPWILFPLCLLTACPSGGGGDDDVSGDDDDAVNSAPVVTSVTLEPDFAHTDDTLTAAAEATDADGDAVTYRWAWFSGDDAIVDAPDSPELDGELHFDKGERIRVEVTAVDPAGAESAPVASASVEVLNSAPSVPQLSISPLDPIHGIDNIVCDIAVGSTDADGDAVDYGFSWDRNTEPVGQKLNETHRPGDTVPAGVTEEGDVWMCWVEATDGSDPAPAVSISVTVQ